MKKVIVLAIGLLLVLSTAVLAGDIEMAKRYGVKDETPAVSQEAELLPMGIPVLRLQLRDVKTIYVEAFADQAQVRELGPSFINTEKGNEGDKAQVKELGPSFINVEKGGDGDRAQVKELGPSFINVENGGGDRAQVKELGPSFINVEK